MHVDFKITNGLLLDGTGAPARKADILVRRGRIADVGDLSAMKAPETIDAAGKYVCPGFIDVHSHSDAYLLIEPSAPSKIFQGVTTEVVGNCGASAAPIAGAYRMPSDWAEQRYPNPWQTVAEYRIVLAKSAPAVNVVLLIGHNSIRAGVMGYEPRAARADEIRQMENLLDQALEEGGAGLSTGLVYQPGMFAEASEVVELARVAARRGKIYTSHMRSEGKRLLEAIDETLDVGRKTGIRVQVSHLKTSGQKNWHLLDGALDRIRKARETGLDVASDRYPYTASSTDLDVILPDWASGGGREIVLGRVRDASERKKIREEILASRGENYWSTVMIGSTWHADNAKFQGERLPDIAKALGLEPVDAALHLMDSDELRTSAIFFGMSEDNMWRILAEPYVMIGSDGSLRSPEGPLSHDHPHPRAYGSFPRFLRASLDGRTVPLPEAIRKMTSLAAEQFLLKDRGVIAKGKFADIVVFDAARVQEKSTFMKPHQLSEGIDELIVNGMPTIHQGRPTGKRAGIFLA